jgi:hypothetical protein
MLRTGIPVSQWEREGDSVIMTAARLIAAEDAPDPEPTDDEIRTSWGV